jgi:putative nucleotidyltransferase with HDIG domain
VHQDTASAAELAERLVGPLGQRWRHVQIVAKRAQEVAAELSEHERDDLVAAAWLHDVGYAAEVADTGFHPLDGARYLRRSGWPERVVNLVAHHSGARFEAAERGLAAELDEFPFVDSPLLDALALADLTVGPAGQSVTYDERIDEVLTRYAADHPVHRTWLGARHVMAKAVERGRGRLERQPR